MFALGWVRTDQSQTGAIDDVHRAVGAVEDAEANAEGKQIVQTLGKLKYELQHDRLLTPLLDDGEADIKGYNDELAALASPTWFNVPWLYAECYLYRYQTRMALGERA